MIREERVLERFFRYVRIASETRHEGDMQRALVEDLKALGLSPSVDVAGEAIGGNGNNIYCHVDGDESAEPLMFESHMDTVQPGIGIEPYIDGDYVKSKGDTILGADDKAGIAAIMEALTVIKEEGLPHRPLDIVFTVSEEIGLNGAKNIDISRIRARKAVVLDGGEGIGRIVNEAPGMNVITAEIKGKAAHAGVMPEKGISSIITAAKAVSSMQLLRIDDETTANIGSFEAPGLTNIVNEHAKLTFEVRSRNAEKLTKYTREIIEKLQSACDESGAELLYKLENSCPAFQLGTDSGIARIMADMCERHGIAYYFAKAGGASNANIYNGKGIEAVNVGTGMEKVHTTEEQLNLKIYRECLNAVLWLMTEY